MSEEYQDCIRVAQAELTFARNLLSNEIRNYPTPISGCDAQFNHLLERRKQVSAAIRSLQEAVFVPTPRSPSANSGIESR